MGQHGQEQVTLERRGRIAVLTLNRPNNLNAFTFEMADRLVAALDELSRDDQVRAVVITGAGNAFCAGADLSMGAGGFAATSARAAATASSAAVAHRDVGGVVTLALYRFRKPLIAAINGAAIGVGVTMTLPMDIRVAAEDAKVGFVFARRGIVPEACSSYFLPRIVGMSKALEWCVTGRVFEARHEAASGLFNYVVPRANVLPRALELAAEIADNTSATSVALSKALLWGSMRDGGASPESAHLAESKCVFWSSQQEDAAEGVLSFKQKRSPAFTLSAATDMPDFYPWWHMTDVRGRL